ncbi:MAG: hypothetical protein GY719_30375 [bacterium]|nr:hypothetical protein [bacterium]
MIKEPPDEGLDIGHVIELLQEFEMLNHGCTVALLIDNIERNARLGRRSVQFYTDLRQLVENSPLSNRVIIIATADTSFLSLESGFISGLLHRLPPQYIQALAFEETRYLAEKAEEICCDPKRQTIVKFLFEQTGGHPCLIQDLLARALQVENSKSRPLLERIQQEAARISHSGTSYFSEFVQRINLEELTYLEALALNLVVDKWPISAKSMDRFKCAGLVKTEDATTDATPSCKLFFSWLKNNAGKLIQFSRSFLPRANDPTSVGQLLSRALPLAVGTRKINSEKEIQNLVQAILASHELPFKREASRGKYQGKTFRPDFIIDELDLAIEVKLVKDPSRITKLVDEIIVDREAYLSSFFTAIFLIYDLTGKVGDHEFFSSDNPYAKYIVL